MNDAVRLCSLDTDMRLNHVCCTHGKGSMSLLEVRFVSSQGARCWHCTKHKSASFSDPAKQRGLMLLIHVMNNYSSSVFGLDMYGPCFPLSDTLDFCLWCVNISSGPHVPHREPLPAALRPTGPGLSPPPPPAAVRGLSHAQVSTESTQKDGD